MSAQFPVHALSGEIHTHTPEAVVGMKEKIEFFLHFIVILKNIYSLPQTK